MDVALALVAGGLIGLSLGALGGGGSILAVPVLVFLLDQSPVQATTGSLVVVGVGAVIGALTAHRSGTVLLGRGLVFGATATGGAVLGATASSRVDEDVLLGAFAVLLLLVAALMVVKQVRRRATGQDEDALLAAALEPIIRVNPEFMCRCPQAAKVLVTATAVGLLTGFLGVGGGFLIVPALVLSLRLPTRHATGTSLVVIAVTSTVALTTRVVESAGGSAPAPDWALVAVLTTATAAASYAGARLAQRTDPRRLSQAFTALVLLVAAATAGQALPALV